MAGQLARSTWVAAFWVLAVGCGEVGPLDEQDELGSTSQKIVGGQSTVISNFPWQVSLQSLSGSHFCGGSIVADKWVLTAQHCVDGQTASSLRVVAGITQRSQSASGQIRAVQSIVRYPGFSMQTLRNDLALLQLATPLDLSGPNAKAVALATPADASAGLTAAGVMATVTGWGTLSQGSPSLPNTLQMVDVPLVSNATAQAAYVGDTLYAEQIAAGGNAEDSCQGDSGGPLVVQASNGTYKQVGIVSYGNGCGNIGFPGIYTRVSSYTTWIDSKTQANSSGGTGGGGSNPGGGTTPPPSTNFSGVEFTQSAVSGTSGSWKDFGLAVPAGVTKLQVSISGGTGDADLYVRAGSLPTSALYDCRPFKNGNVETCTLAVSAAGNYFLSLNAYKSYKNVTLTADYQ